MVVSLVGPTATAVRCRQCFSLVGLGALWGVRAFNSNEQEDGRPVAPKTTLCDQHQYKLPRTTIDLPSAWDIFLPSYQTTISTDFQNPASELLDHKAADIGSLISSFPTC